MQNTNNLSLKKPEYTDFADIADINDNMDTLDAAVHDTKDSVVAFTSSDVADGSATAWTTVTPLASGEKHRIMFAKISQMFKNIRFLYKLLGTTDISSIGNGTVTGGLSSSNDSFTTLNIVSAVRYARTVTTGNTGNVSLGVRNDGYNVIVGAHVAGASFCVRAWVAHLNDDNESWYLTVINPNTGATVNNTSVNIRYTLIILKTTSSQ